MTNKMFTAAAIERAERMAKRSKTLPIPDGKTFEQVVGEHARDGMAWLQVFQALHFLEDNPLVTVSAPALDFVRVVRELARGGYMTAGVEEALLPLDTLLPKGKLGEQSSRAHAVAAAAPRKLWPNDIKKINLEYQRRVRAGERRGAITELAAQYEVSTKTISRTIKAK